MPIGSLQPGTALGSYSVTAKIGEGGMGEVYRARDMKLDRDVALKVLRAPAASGLGIAFGSLGRGASTHQMAK